MNIQHDIYILFAYRTFKAKEIASKMCAWLFKTGTSGEQISSTIFFITSLKQ